MPAPCAAAVAAPAARAAPCAARRFARAALPLPRRARCRPRRFAARAAASGDDAPRAGLKILQMPSFVPKALLIGAQRPR